MSDAILRVNNREFSSASAELVLAGSPMSRVTSIEWSQTRERKKLVGMNRAGKPVARSRGTYVPGMVKIRFTTAGFEYLTDALTLLGAGSYGDAEFMGMLTLFETKLARPHVVVWEDMTIAGETTAFSDDGEVIGTDVEFDCMSVIENFKILYSVGVL
jgi:hypothetical protein